MKEIKQKLLDSNVTQGQMAWRLADIQAANEHDQADLSEMYFDGIRGSSSMSRDELAEELAAIYDGSGIDEDEEIEAMLEIVEDN